MMDNWTKRERVQVTKLLEVNLRFVSRRSRLSETVQGPQGATGHYMKSDQGYGEPVGGEH